MQNNTVIGRITKELELRKTSTGKSVLDINLAINNNKDDTTYMNITVFDKMAENCSKYLNKGSLIAVQYIIRNHNWEDKQGKKHYDYSFIATNVIFLENKKKDKEEAKEEVKEETDTDKIFKEFREETFGVDDTSIELPF